VTRRCINAGRAGETGWYDDRSTPSLPTVTTYAWRDRFDSSEISVLHAEGFGHPVLDDEDWWGQVNRHSLGWVCARDEGTLVGFVNVVWDGGVHAFVLDTLVAQAHRRRGIATGLIAQAVTGARAAGCEWLHVDFEDHLQAFYFQVCGFTPTSAGLIGL
jgi:GNAT superfamily N-acetyltransferase